MAWGMDSLADAAAVTVHGNRLFSQAADAALSFRHRQTGTVTLGKAHREPEAGTRHGRQQAAEGKSSAVF